METDEDNRRAMLATQKVKQKILDAISELKVVSENDERKNKILSNFFREKGKFLGHYI